MNRTPPLDVAPSAARLTSSLRDIGYDFPTAIADLIDNSIVAGASHVDVDVDFDGPASTVTIADDGTGMTANGLTEAMRFGTRRSYTASDLGRYGLGLKTASMSQCRSLTVVTRRSATNRVITRRTLDLDLIQQFDAWLLFHREATPAVKRATARLSHGPGTVVVWEKLDRMLPGKDPGGGWARRRLSAHTQQLADHLGMIFHRYIEGRAGGHTLTITVNGEKVSPWNPFAPDEPHTRELPPQAFDIRVGDTAGQVRLLPHILPARDKFSSPAEFDRMSGPARWNRQQGIYVYRAGRLVQWGGWNGLRAIDEHTKLARVALEFDTDLDDAFHINVAKMRITIPAELRRMLERPIHELCNAADDTYRNAAPTAAVDPGPVRRGAPTGVPAAAGLALRSAAMELGHSGALRQIVALLRERDPALVHSLGLD